MTLSADQRQERLSRPCKRCGKPLSSLTKTQVACTGGCLGWNKTVDVECKVCGVSFEAKEGRLKKYGDLCCSKQCQRQLAVKSRWEDLNRIKSSLAKAKNHKTRSRDRYMKSEFRKWSLVAAPRADDRRRPPAVARRARQSVPVRDRSGPGDAERDHRRQLRHRIAAALQPATLAVIVGERVPGIDERHDDVTAPGQEQHRLGRLRRRRVIEPQRHARRAPRLEGLRLFRRDLVTLLSIWAQKDCVICSAIESSETKAR